LSEAERFQTEGLLFNGPTAGETATWAHINFWPFVGHALSSDPAIRPHLEPLTRLDTAAIISFCLFLTAQNSKLFK